MGGIDLLSEIGDGRLVKMEIDYTDQVDKGIPDAEKLAKSGKLREAIDGLFILEKQTRLAADMRSNQKVLLALVRLCYEQKNWDLLNETILAITKKRSLIKHAVSKCIQECCTYVDQTPDKDSKMKLIEILRTVTAGKIYVEVERARLTYKLSKIKEAEGDLEEASKVLLDLQIETYGSMEKQEKVEMLLEQMRLCLARANYVRASIISNKINTKFFEETSNEVQEQKLSYFKLMIQLDEHDEKYLNICRHYMAVYNTPKIQADTYKLQEALKNVVIYLILSPHTNEQSDLLHRIKEDRNLEKITEYKDLLSLMTVQELINWKTTICGVYEKTLREGMRSEPPTGIFDEKLELGRKRWQDFQIRIVEHNMRMIAKYYSTITLKRLSLLLDWPMNKTEEFLCDLVVNGTIVGAKIDRPAGIVRFAPKRSPTEQLDDWSNNLKSLMDVLNKVTHLILKEEMVHRHLHGHKAGASSSTS